MSSSVLLFILLRALAKADQGVQEGQVQNEQVFEVQEKQDVQEEQVEVVVQEKVLSRVKRIPIAGYLTFGFALLNMVMLVVQNVQVSNNNNNNNNNNGWYD